MQERRIDPWEDPLEKEMTTQSSVLAWEMPWTERRLVGYHPWGHKRVKHKLATKKQQCNMMHRELSITS